MANNPRYNQNFPRVANKQERAVRESSPGVEITRCPKCGGPIGRFLSKWGAYKQCVKYPRCDWRG